MAVPRPGRLPGHAGRQPGPVARVHRGAAFPRPPGCARAECAEAAAPTARAAQGRLPRLRRVLRRLPELDAPARPRVRRAARTTAGHERSGSYPTRGPGVAGRVDVRGSGASVDELRDRGPPVPRASERSRRRSRRRDAAARMDQPVPGQPDRRRRQFAQDCRLCRQPAADQCAPEGAERPVDDGRRVVAAGVAIERLHDLARRAQREAGRAARRRRRSRGHAHRRRSARPTSRPRT